jgi:hypothetical protein
MGLFKPLPGFDSIAGVEIVGHDLEAAKTGGLMHGQKKRHKRPKEGLIEIDSVSLCWRLLSEPQWTTEHGYKGLCISVRTEDERHRELILEYPFDRKRALSRLPLPKLPQRPKFSVKTIEAVVRQAIKKGWDPASRGKTFLFRVPGQSN